LPFGPVRNNFDDLPLASGPALAQIRVSADAGSAFNREEDEA
jgi:hypothetical protein